jgi:hypothetical protein
VSFVFIIRAFYFGTPILNTQLEKIVHAENEASKNKLLLIVLCGKTIFGLDCFALSNTKRDNYLVLSVACAYV